MKISVCIPVYNFDVRELVFSLSKEIENHKLNAEIILIDDASSKDFITINEPLKDLVNQFIFLEKNIGRSSIRNLFLKYASGDFLLFLDCDAKIISENFLKNYLQFIKENKESKVVFGGRITSLKKPYKKFLLRWKYAINREQLSLTERKKKPHLSFQSNNFIIKKTVLEKNIFNTDLKGYGYEDLLFSMLLKKNRIEIFHIENYISNIDYEPNQVFVTKSEEASKNLSSIYNSSQKELISEIKLVYFYEKLRFWRIEKLYLIFFRLYKNHLRKIISKNSSLLILDLYKLGCFIENVKV